MELVVALKEVLDSGTLSSPSPTESSPSRDEPVADTKQLKALLQSLSDSQVAYNTSRSEAQRLRESLDETQFRLDQVKQDGEEKRHEVNELQNRILDLENDLSRANQRATDRVKRLREEEKQRREGEVQEEINHREKLEDRLDQLQRTRSQLEADLATARNRYGDSQRGWNEHNRRLMRHLCPRRWNFRVVEQMKLSESCRKLFDTPFGCGSTELDLADQCQSLDGLNHNLRLQVRQLERELEDERDKRKAVDERLTLVLTQLTSLRSEHDRVISSQRAIRYSNRSRSRSRESVLSGRSRSPSRRRRQRRRKHKSKK